MPDHRKSQTDTKFGVTYSLADQNFSQTKSIGILNVSVQWLESLAQRNEISPLTVLSNRSLDGRLQLPSQVAVQYHEGPVRGRFGRIFWDQSVVYREARKLKNEWLFLPKGFASFVQPCPVRLALYVHDAVHDFYRKHYPRSVPFFEQHYFEKCFRANLRYADLIVTNSDFSASEVGRLAKAAGIAAPETVTVGMGFIPFGRGTMPKEDRVVVLTTRWPHKRPDLAVDFLSRWQRETKYAGRVDWLGSLPKDLVFPEFSNWQRHPRLPDDQFQQLIQRARALVYTSAYEGFGMPPVEAVTAGTCPVFSELAATREVMQECGCAFKNDSFPSFVAAMTKAFAVSPSVIDRWSAELIARHNWENTAQRTVQALLEKREASVKGR